MNGLRYQVSTFGDVIATFLRLDDAKEYAAGIAKRHTPRGSVKGNVTVYVAEVWEGYNPLTRYCGRREVS
jgi:hypothetical protein